MEPAPFPSQAYFYNDNQQRSGPDTKKVGVWLEQPTFTHGQLFVAASWVASRQHIQFTVNKSVSINFSNVAYEEIL